VHVTIEARPAEPLGAFALLESGAWIGLDDAAANDASVFLRLGLASARRADALAGAGVVAEIRLAMAQEKTEFCFRIGATREALAEAAESVFGARQDDDETLRDLVRELANLIAGAFKGAAAKQSVDLTMGLPIIRDAAERGEPLVLASKSFVLVDGRGTISIGVCVDVLRSQREAVRVDALVEGMELAHAVVDRRGTVVVPSGRLSELRIDRMRQAFAPDLLVEVSTT
jgi:hypothetical protein